MTTKEVLAQWTNEYNYCAPRNDYYFNLSNDSEILTQEKKQGQKFLMDLGRKLPGNKTHAKHWIKNGNIFDVIGTHDIKPFAAFCEKIGIEPEFKLTKSGTFVRLVNNSEFNQAIKTFYGL